jgi:hypothetical protein
VDALNTAAASAHVDTYFKKKQLRLHWLEGCECLQRLHCNVGSRSLSRIDLPAAVVSIGRLTALTSLDLYVVSTKDPYFDYGSSLTGLVSLTALRELDRGIDWLLGEEACGPLTALGALTALTLQLGEWHELFGPLPPALDILTLYLTPPQVYVQEESEEARRVFEPLESRGLRSSLSDDGAAPPPLRRLRIIMNLERARLPPNEEHGGDYQDFVVDLRLNAFSIPCAFPSLEEFTFTLKDAARPIVSQSADLVALLEAAPALRHVRLSNMNCLSIGTIQWLLAHRPGFRAGGAPRSIVLELPPPPPSQA